MRKLQTSPEMDHFRNAGLKFGAGHVWINANGETGPLDEQVANALLTRGGFIDVTPEEDLPHEDALAEDEESLRPRRRGRKAKGEDEAAG